MVFVYHMTLQDHVTKLLYDFMVRSPSRYVAILPNFVAIALWHWRYNGFSFARDLGRKRDRRVMRLYG